MGLSKNILQNVEEKSNKRVLILSCLIKGVSQWISDTLEINATMLYFFWQ